MNDISNAENLLCFMSFRKPPVREAIEQNTQDEGRGRRSWRITCITSTFSSTIGCAENVPVDGTIAMITGASIGLYGKFASTMSATGPVDIGTKPRHGN